MPPKQEKGRVIVTYGRSIIALMIAQSLGSRGIEVVGCDDVGMTVLSFSKYVTSNHVYTPAEKSEKRFIADLIKIAKQNKPDDSRPYLLIPAFRDAKIIAKYKHRFDGLITVACPDYEAIERIDTKDRFAATLEELGVEAPRTWMPKSKAELTKLAKNIDFPVFVKPPDDVGGRGISRVKNAAQLEEAFLDLQKRYRKKQILVQEEAKGKDYCFCGLFDHGRLKASMVYHNIHKLPQETGAGVVRKTVKDDNFRPIVKKLMKPLKWHGVAEIDFMWDGKAKTKPAILEVNARFWAGLDHSVKSGMDFPYLLYRLFTTGKLAYQKPARIGHKTSLPGLSTIARVEELFDNAFHFDELAEKWPEIKDRLKKKDLLHAAEIFTDALSETITLDEAFKSLKLIIKEAKNTEKIAYSKDDPFIGLGVLFILGSLLKHGKLPPEITS